MADEMYLIGVNSFEQRVLVQGMNRFRNDLSSEGKPTEDVDDLLLKLIDARPVKKRREEREER